MTELTASRVRCDHRGRHMEGAVSFHRAVVLAGTIVLTWLVAASRLVAAADGARPFAIRVVDADTGRGVPLVVLKTTNEQSFITDSAGYVAIDGPDLLGRKVYFHVWSHGYEFPKDGFGYRGKALDVQAGGEATLQIRRLNIAERLYRVTGGGIYVESVRLRKPAPLREPLASGLVMGQDSVQAAVFNGTIHWFWGDTNQLRYPLGQFRTSGATSRPPSQGGLDPDVGVDLTYFVNEEGFSRPMFDGTGPGVVWLDGLCVVPDAAGRERLIGHYSRRESLEKQLAHGIAEFDPQTARFQTLVELPESTHSHPLGQAMRARSEDGGDYMYFANPFPNLRVPATLEAILDPAQYSSFTPLPAKDENRSEASPLAYAWRRGVEPVSIKDERRLIEQGQLKADQAHWQTVNAETGEKIDLHAGSVRWNEHRQRYVMIAVQQFGQASFLGEVWYGESKRPEGPWTKLVQIVTHDKYSFYNPVQHPFFDEDGGRVIYFEGTYTHTFSGNPVPTPRYDYNQILYRLNLDDPRLASVRE